MSFFETKIKVMKREDWASQTTATSNFVCWPCTMPVSRHSYEEPKISVAGIGYVGLCIATLLAQYNEVTSVDIVTDRVEKVINRISPILDDFIERFFGEDLALSNANEVAHKEQYLAAMMNSEVLFGVITDKQKCLIYEIDVNAQLKCKGHFSLAQMCHYFNSLWIDLDVYPPLEENDYSYTKSGGATDIIVDKLDAAYIFGSQTAVASGVAHPILLTYDMLTLLLGFQPNNNGDLELNGFVVNNNIGKFFHKGKRLTYLSQFQQCYRREMGELAIDEISLPNYII